MDTATGIAVTLNGAPHTVPAGLSVAALIEELGLTGRRLAVELNREILPRSTHRARTLKAGDRLEIIHAIGGG